MDGAPLPLSDFGHAGPATGVRTAVPLATYASSVPSTVADIFAAADASPAGVVCWGTPPALPAPPRAVATGIYVVSLSDRLDGMDGALADAPISTQLVDELLAERKELRMDGARPTVEQLANRLAAFWLPDEVIVYIGLAGPRKSPPKQGELANRVREYYATPLGANGPHAGGWPLKTLACLHELYVHYAYCDNVNTAEATGIGHFAAHVSDETRRGLRDPVRVMPFANLEFPKGNAKAHGIRGPRAPSYRRFAGRTMSFPFAPVLRTYADATTLQSATRWRSGGARRASASRALRPVRVPSAPPP